LNKDNKEYVEFIKLYGLRLGSVINSFVYLVKMNHGELPTDSSALVGVINEALRNTILYVECSEDNIIANRAVLTTIDTDAVFRYNIAFESTIIKRPYDKLIMYRDMLNNTDDPYIHKTNKSYDTITVSDMLTIENHIELMTLAQNLYKCCQPNPTDDDMFRLSMLTFTDTVMKKILSDSIKDNLFPSVRLSLCAFKSSYSRINPVLKYHVKTHDIRLYNTMDEFLKDCNGINP
jgi:hypothetical protein